MRRAIAGVVLFVALSALALQTRADPATPARVASGAVLDAVPHGPSVDERLAVIQQRIQGALVYPPLALRRGTQGTARVAFTIGADGRARDVAVAQSSGFALLDRAALRAVHDADRLPYVYGRLEVPVRFELQPQTPDLAATH